MERPPILAASPSNQPRSSRARTPRLRRGPPRSRARQPTSKLHQFPRSLPSRLISHLPQDRPDLPQRGSGGTVSSMPSSSIDSAPMNGRPINAPISSGVNGPRSTPRLLAPCHVGQQHVPAADHLADAGRDLRVGPAGGDHLVEDPDVAERRSASRKSQARSQRTHRGSGVRTSRPGVP